MSYFFVRSEISQTTLVFTFLVESQTKDFFSYLTAIATTRNILVLLETIWIVPPLVFLLYIFIPEGFQFSCETTFIGKFSFRLLFSMFLIVPLVLMCFIYAHILWVIHVQTRIWARGGITGNLF